MAILGRKIIYEYIRQSMVVSLTYCTATNKSKNLKNVKNERLTAVKPSDAISNITQEEFKGGLKRASKKLQEIFNIQPFSALEIISKNKKITKVPIFLIRSNYELLIKNNINKSTIMKYPSVLCETTLVTKWDYLKQLSYENTNELVPLLMLSLNNLKILTLTEAYQKKIETIANTLEATIEEICYAMVQRPFLISMEFERLILNLAVLKEYGIMKNQILKDLWVLKYKPDMIRSRLDMAKKSNVDVLKTWMIRVPIKTYQKHIKKKSDHKMLLGNNSFLQYLSERLNCSEDVAKYILMKQPAIQNRNIKKLNEMIDFLLSYGYTTTHIIRSPKILVHSVQTCQKRLKELEEARVHLDGISLLTKSKKQYTQYLESVKCKVKSTN